jgi:hypothetical protein
VINSGVLIHRGLQGRCQAQLRPDVEFRSLHESYNDMHVCSDTHDEALGGMQQEPPRAQS